MATASPTGGTWASEHGDMSRAQPRAKFLTHIQQHPALNIPPRVGLSGRGLRDLICSLTRSTLRSGRRILTSSAGAHWKRGSPSPGMPSEPPRARFAQADLTANSRKNEGLWKWETCFLHLEGNLKLSLTEIDFTSQIQYFSHVEHHRCRFHLTDTVVQRARRNMNPPYGI